MGIFNSHVGLPEGTNPNDVRGGKWRFPKSWGMPKNGWFIVEHTTKMDDDWGTPILGNLHFRW